MAKQGKCEIEPWAETESEDLEREAGQRISGMVDDYIALPGEKSEEEETQDSDTSATERHCFRTLPMVDAYDYIALPGEWEEDETQPDTSAAERHCLPESKGNLGDVVLTMAICCVTAAALLLVTGWFILWFQGASPDGDGRNDLAPENSNAEFLIQQRTSFHFQPETNYMSDPCAPMYCKGWYHLFYHYNPIGAGWRDISWGHTVSKDLIHWVYLEEILRPSESYDIFGIWSGYATILKDGSPVIIYTGGLAEQYQNMALPEDPSDPLLRKWWKSERNPIMLNPDFIRPQGFRAPTTAWLENDGLWIRVPLGSRAENDDGTVSLMYTRSDFHGHCTLMGTVLGRVAGTGMWECLNLFPILSESRAIVKHSVLQSSYRQPGSWNFLRGEHYHNGWRHDQYALGTYSLETHTFEADDKSMDVGIGLRYDWGKFYASKTFYDGSTRRRILWGYVNESDSESDDIKKGWAGAMAIPRTLSLDPMTKSNLVVWPVEEVEGLRRSHTSHHNIPLAPQETWKVKGGDGNQLDILVTFERPNVSAMESLGPDEAMEFDCGHGGSAHRGTFGPFGILVLADDKLIEQTAIFFYIHHRPDRDGQWGTKVCSDQSRSSLAKGIDKTAYGSYLTVLPQETDLSLRVLVDHSMVESFVQGGRFAITARVYPQVALGNNANVFLFNNGTTPVTIKSVDVYKMGTVTIPTLGEPDIALPKTLVNDIEE